jgi:hypothetical protein
MAIRMERLPARSTNDIIFSRSSNGERENVRLPRSASRMMIW